MSVFKFGKHVGREIAECPTPYLEWAVRNVKQLDSSQLREIADILSARDRDKPGCRTTDVAELWRLQMVNEFGHDAHAIVNRGFALLQKLLYK